MELNLKILPLSKLQITQVQLRALLLTYVDLQFGVLAPFPKDIDKVKNNKLIESWTPKLFDMSAVVKQTPCGTAVCIGGDMAYHAGFTENNWHKFTRNVEHKPIWNLFFPEELPVSKRWFTITPKQGAKAIENFLATGKPDWKNAVKVLG